MNPKDVIKYAKDLKKTRHTNNPYAIAEYYGIRVTFLKKCLPGFTAQTTKVENYPTYITINDAYTAFSKKILCAHELGHALLHSETLNDNIKTGPKSLSFEACFYFIENHIFPLPIKVYQLRLYRFRTKGLSDGIAI